MSKISKQEVENVAKLSRLALDDKEIEEMQADMSNILDFISKINELDTEGIEPTAHVLDVSNVTREDVVGESMNRDDIMKLAPESTDGFIVVPKVIN